MTIEICWYIFGQRYIFFRMVDRIAERKSGIPTSSQSETAARITKQVLNLVLPGPRDYSVKLWNGDTQPNSPDLPSLFTLELNHPGTLRRMFFPPSQRGLAEAFIRGDFDVEGDLISCIGLRDRIELFAADPKRWPRVIYLLSKLPESGVKAAQWRGEARLEGATHSQERDRLAIGYHYGLPLDFYGFFLDKKHRQYSCAYFPTENTGLEEAQEAKLEHISRKLRLQPGDRLLDVGCGYGGLITFAAINYDVKSLGITLSRDQADFGNQRIKEAGLGDRCKIEVRDYRQVKGRFNKVVSVGMVEHVGKAKLPEYYGTVFELLEDGGLFLCHGIADMQTPKSGLVGNLAAAVVNRGGDFIQKYVFPDGELVRVSTSADYAERAGFEIRDVESLREHYALTLRHWLDRLEQHREEALKLVGEQIYRVWLLYFAGSAYSFDANRINVYQTLLGKPGEKGESGMPLTRLKFALKT